MYRRSSWLRVLTKAEKLVGYPSSFLNLRHLLSDELSNVVMQMRQLVGTQHPLLKTVRGLVGDGKSLSQNRGLIVLLLARSAKAAPIHQSQHNNRSQLYNVYNNMFYSPAGSVTSDEHVTGLTPDQRSLAEIVETVHMAMVFHRGIVDVEQFPGLGTNSEIRRDLEFGNKMTTLIGDFLLASVSTSLAQLHNTKVVESISEGISEMIESEFTDVVNASAPSSSSAASLTQDDWENYVHLSRGSLLSRCAVASLQLADNPAPSITQATIAEFSRYWSRLYRLAEERSAAQSDKWPWEIPGLAHIIAGTTTTTFSSRTTCLEWTSEMQDRMDEYAHAARDALYELPLENDATRVLEEMVTALCDDATISPGKT